MTKAKTDQEKNTERILRALDELGGQNVTEDNLVFEGSRFVLPEQMAGPGGIRNAVRFLQQWDEQQNTNFGFVREFNFRPFDGAAAFDRAMKRVFGTSGIGQATMTFFGPVPPQLRTVQAGPNGETIQVPWGEVNFSPLDATFQLDYTHSREYGIVFQLAVEAPRKHRRRVEGFFKVVEEELRERSIYKGHAITGDNMEPSFLDVAGFDPSKVIYRQEVLTQLDVNLWAPLRYSQALRNSGVQLKRAVLLEGPNGTGKTLAGLRTAQIAQENGWTYILVRPDDDPLEALKTARIYAPAVVWVEDLDVIANSEDPRNNRAKIARVLDVLDNVQGKGVEVMAGFTSNFAGKLDKGVMRPGRLDAVIHVGELDNAGYGRLVRSLISPALLAPDVDYDRVAQAYHGFLPAFAAEATTRAIRYSVAENQGRPAPITTQNLVDAANGMRDHLRLMDEAQHGGQTQTTLDSRIVDIFRETLDSTEGKFGGGVLEGSVLELAESNGN